MRFHPSVQHLGQLIQRRPINPHPQPLRHPLCPNTLVKLDARLIPLQNTPLQPRPLHSHHLFRQLHQQLLPVPLPSLRRLDKQVFEVDAWLGAPGAVVVEVEGHADGGVGGVEEEEAAGGAGG